MPATLDAKPSDFPVDRSNYFAEGEYLKTDIARGVTRNRGGTRMLSLTGDFLLGLRKAFQQECGPAADDVFVSCGKHWGKQFAARFEKELSDYYGMPLREFRVSAFLACLTESFLHHGWGRLAIDMSRQEQGVLIAVVDNAVFADLVGASDAPTDVLMAGILGAMFSHFSGEDLDCVQTQCRSTGATDSRFVIGLASRLSGVPAMVKAGRRHEDIVEHLAGVRA